MAPTAARLRRKWPVAFSGLNLGASSLQRDLRIHTHDGVADHKLEAMKPRMPMTSAMMKIRSPSRLLLAS